MPMRPQPEGLTRKRRARMSGEGGTDEFDITAVVQNGTQKSAQRIGYTFRTEANKWMPVSAFGAMSPEQPFKTHNEAMAWLGAAFQASVANGAAAAPEPAVEPEGIQAPEHGADVELVVLENTAEGPVMEGQPVAELLTGQDAGTAEEGVPAVVEPVPAGREEVSKFEETESIRIIPVEDGQEYPPGWQPRRPALIPQAPPQSRELEDGPDWDNPGQQEVLPDPFADPFAPRPGDDRNPVL